jgi:hypothetical protein
MSGWEQAEFLLPRQFCKRAIFRVERNNESFLAMQDRRILRFRIIANRIGSGRQGRPLEARTTAERIDRLTAILRPNYEHLDSFRFEIRISDTGLTIEDTHTSLSCPPKKGLTCHHEFTLLEPADPVSQKMERSNLPKLPSTL